MSDIRKLRDLYGRDPVFHQLVTSLAQMIETFKLSPSEVRDAAMFAAYLVEMRNPMPRLQFPNDPEKVPS